MSEKYTFTVENEPENARIDQFLTEKTEFSRSFLRKLIKTGYVSVAGKKVLKPSHVLKMHDEIVLNVPEAGASDLEPEHVDLKIYYEDEHLIVVEKPAFMVTHPTASRKTGSLVNALLAHFGSDLSTSGGALRPGIVHRLDEDTSGLLVVAKTNKAHQALGDLFRAREVKKTYVALLSGILEPKEGSIEAPLTRAQDTTRMRVSPAKSARNALTHYKVLEYLEDAYSYTEVQIVTGRTHQIRVHFRAIDHPVVGDKKYGFPKINEDFEKRFGLKRQFLHAKKLGFIHPFTGKKLEFESTLPEDLLKVLTGIGHGSNG